MAHARNTDPDTSHEAAASVNNETITKKRILTLLSTGPMTDETLTVNFNAKYGHENASPSGIRSRRADLTRVGLVVGFVDEQGEPVKRKTVSGRRARLWMAKDAAIALVPDAELVSVS